MKQNLLNKLWLRVCMIVAIMTTALAGTAWAEEATFDFTSMSAIAAGEQSFTEGKISIVCTNGAVSAQSSTMQLRWYANQTLTISADAGYTITAISITKGAGDKGTISLADNAPGTLSGQTSSGSGNVATWSGSAESVAFTTAGQSRVINITVTYVSAGGTPTCAAPTFSPAAGTYTGAQSVTLSTTTENATIYYTTDGTDPTENSEVFSSAISVTTTTTIKAIAVASGYDNSSVASATYNIISIEHAGTEADPYTVADARAAIDANTGVTEVYATGIVSAIPTAWNTTYNNITFNFVDNSGDEDFLQAFRCVSGTGVDASTVAVGDIVVVKGNLKKYNSTYEFDAACQLVSLTKPVVAVEAPVFSPEGGVYTTAQTISIAVAAPTLDGYAFYYTTDGTEPTENSTLYTAPIEISTTTTLKAIAVKGGEVSTVTTAVYAILAHAGTEADPYTVADARAAIDANAGLTDVYATGIVSEIVQAWDDGHKNITFNFVDTEGDNDFLEAYRCVSTDDADASTVAVGDVVVVKGTLKLYGATYEFGSGCQLVSLTHSGTPTEPVIVAQDATIAADVTYYELMYSIENPVQGTDLKATTTASWITSLTPSTKSFDRVMIECEANNETTARTATIVLAYGNVTKEVTLTQEAYVAPVADYAELPFSFDGGKADIEDTDGLTQEGMGTDYGTAPKLRFDTTGDNLLLAFNERPGVLTFDIKGNSFSDGTFKVQASVDGTTYSDVATYTELGSKETKTINDLGEDVRYIKWVYTEKVSGNVALGNINLAKYGTVVLNDYYLTIANPANVTITASYGQDVLTNGEIEEVTEGTEVTVALTIADGYDLQSVTVNGTDDGQAVTLSPGTTEGVYTFTMPAFNVTVNATAVEHVDPVTASYVLATTITSGKTYVIASGADEGEVQVMAEQRTNNRGAVTATITNGILNVSDEYEFVIETANIGEASGYSIFDPDAKGYLYAANSSKNYLMTQTDNDINGVWTITIDATTGEASVVAEKSSNRNYMHYNPNNGSPIFSCYAETSSITAPVYFFEKVGGATPTVQTVTVTDAGYATMVAEANLEIPTDVDVKVYAVQVTGFYAALIQVTDGIPAGEAVLVKAAAGDYNFTSTTNTVSKVKVNDLVAATQDVVATGTQYVLAKSASGTVGFCQATAGSTIPAGKAYLIVTSTEVKPFYGFEDDATGIASSLGETEDGAAIYNLAGQRIQKMQRGINIVGGKKILK